MILPIIAYGDSLLRKKSKELTPDTQGLAALIDNMFETMYHAKGIGLAAPQVGASVRLIVIDTEPYFLNDMEESDPEDETPVKMILINPEIIKIYGEEYPYNEGCLSIPGIREDVVRHDKIIVRYLDEQFTVHEEEFFGICSRVIQHEHDHLEGVMFVDHIKPLKKRLLKKSLENISKGKIDIFYEMKFPNKKK